METIKLYETDSYLKEFDAKVVECLPYKDKKGVEKYRIVLDKTAFFPEEGGQTCDTGKFCDTSVTAVALEKGVIYHMTDTPFEVGADVHGIIDWEGRFDKMQNHSGEHIVSGLIHSRFGYTNIGFHLSDNTVTCDFDGKLTEDDAADIERQANEAIYANVPVRAYYYNKDAENCRNIRSKIELGEGVRIVEIEGYDRCACCAPHVKASGEIGGIKILSVTSNKGGARLEIVCGKRAMEDYRRKHDNNCKIIQLLSSKSAETFPLVQKTYDDLTAMRAENQQLKEKLAFLSLSTEKENGCLLGIIEDGEYGYGELRYCANRLLDDNISTALMLAKASDGYLYFLTSKTADTRALTKQLNTLLDGHGGGNAEYTQGKVKAEKIQIQDFFQKLSQGEIN